VPVAVVFPAQLEPGRMCQAPGGGMKRTHRSTPSTRACGMPRAVPKYGARYTYEWMPFAEAKGRQPEIKGQ